MPAGPAVMSVFTTFILLANTKKAEEHTDEITNNESAKKGFTGRRIERKYQNRQKFGKT